MEYKKIYNSLKEEYLKKVAIKNMLEKYIIKNKTLIEEYKEKAAIMDKTIHILNLLSVEAREKAKQRIEEIVTLALKYITEEDYKFEIELTQQRGKPSCEFYVVTKINGIESRQRPEDACGGGLVDIISTALRYVYLSIYNNPKINGPIILDEPGKMVSENASIKFAEFIKYLSETFNKQTIMITHNENIMNISDKTYMVGQIDGVSNVASI